MWAAPHSARRAPHAARPAMGPQLGQPRFVLGSQKGRVDGEPPPRETERPVLAPIAAIRAPHSERPSGM